MNWRLCCLKTSIKKFYSVLGMNKGRSGWQQLSMSKKFLHMDYSEVWPYYPMLLCLSYFGLSLLRYFLCCTWHSWKKNMAPDWDFLRLEISDCFLPATWLAKAETPILEISKSLLQNLQQSFHLLSVFSTHSVNQSSTSQLSLKIHLSAFFGNLN